MHRVPLGRRGSSVSDDAPDADLAACSTSIHAESEACQRGMDKLVSDIAPHHTDAHRQYLARSHGIGAWGWQMQAVQRRLEARRAAGLAVVGAHRAQGREFHAEGIRSFVREAGAGETVLCIHGIPASSFLYRKLLPALARRALRGVAFDLPGLGLADRPAAFAYNWTGLGAWSAAALDALELDRFHLVVHDFGGPVGFELCARIPERILSLTILNTVVEVEHFHRPWALELLARPRISATALRLVPRSAFRMLMWRVGIADRASTSDAELDAWLELLRRDDGGRACVRMARGLERTRAKTDQYSSALRALPVPIQVLWGVEDPVLKAEEAGEGVRRVTGVPLRRLPGKHFLQEDCFEAIAERVARLAALAGASAGR
jgi:haloalkane dehalogenase